MGLELIKKELKDSLSEYRYNHSLNVAEVCKRLATIYNYDCEKAYLAGLLHDIAKEYTKEENDKVIKKYNLSKLLLESNYQKILHSDIGAYVAKEKYRIDDEIFHAIKVHTLGDIPMNILDKILFVADKTEPGKDYPGIEEERKLSFKNLNEALILCLENNHKKIIRNNKKINPRSLEVLNYLKKEVEIKC